MAGFSRSTRQRLASRIFAPSRRLISGLVIGNVLSARRARTAKESPSFSGRNASAVRAIASRSHSACHTRPKWAIPKTRPRACAARSQAASSSISMSSRPTKVRTRTAAAPARAVLTAALSLCSKNGRFLPFSPISS
ncbi:MAG TPA: hypothetical protein DCM87_22455 [Planctomycetes bacterium]|nr:hypothetical protein [Planctomycetota bacterium]